MTRVEYDRLAATYDERYKRYEYAGIEGALLMFAHGAARVLEVGCGTGHYLGVLAQAGHVPVGLDFSAAMLARANGARVRGRAEQLPFAGGSFDRVCAINAFHHFTDKAAFVAEARRVLRPGGGLMIAGLDPHAGARWWIYDYYPDTRAVDCARFPASESIGALALAQGFAHAEAREVQHIASRHAAQPALEQGLLAQSTTSQLALLGQAEYDAGIARLRDDIARDPTLTLETDLHIHATFAWR